MIGDLHGGGYAQMAIWRLAQDLREQTLRRRAQWGLPLRDLRRSGQKAGGTESLDHASARSAPLRG